LCRHDTAVTVLLDSEKGRFRHSFSFSAGDSQTFKLGGVQFTIGREAVETKALKLEVGKGYKRRDGAVVRVVRYSAYEAPFGYRDSDGEKYAPNGSATADNSLHFADLIEEVPPLYLRHALTQ
jgi:hypothetical protein